MALTLLLLGQFVGAPLAVRAGTFDLNDTVDNKEATDEGHFGRQRFTITFDSRFGYDSNALAQPDDLKLAVGVNPITHKEVFQTVDSSGSAFLNFALGVGYTAVNPRLSLTIGADIGVNYYFDRPGRDYDVNGGLSVRVTYKATPRLLLEASSYNAYEAAGDYGATALTNFNGQFNGGTTPGTTADRNGDYFYTTDLLSATYQLTPRVSFTASNTIVAFAYEDDLYSTVQDRIEEYISLEGRYLVTPTLSLALNYRFGYIDYFSVDNDSYTNFALAGFDYSFSPRLHGQVRAGAEFRVYFDTLGDETSPYAEATISYDLSHTSHLAVSARYGIEEGDLSVSNSKADTFRLGIQYDQSFTARLSGYLGFNFTHSFYETPVSNAVVASGFNEDTFDVAVGARYAINRRLSAEVGYTYTTVLSQVDEREYDRHRVFAGIRLAY